MPIAPNDPLLRRKPEWAGEYELDEGCVPGGLTWDEPTAFPMLADFECRDCGQIGGHERGCPNDYAKESPMVECKIDGCENEAVQQMGKYARLCAEHRPTNGRGEGALMIEGRRLADLAEGPTSMGEIEAEGREQYEAFQAESEPCGVCGATRDRDRCSEFQVTGACDPDELVPVAVVDDSDVAEDHTGDESSRAEEGDSPLVRAARRVDELRRELEAAREELFRSG